MPTQSNAVNLTVGVGRGANSFSPAAINPDGHQIMMFSVYSVVGSGTPNVPSIAVTGWTFIQVSTVTYGAFSGTNQRLTKFIGIGPSGSGITPSITFGGQSQTICMWIIDQISNTLLATNATRQPTTFGPHGSGFSITMAAFASLNNATYAVTAKDAVNVIAPNSPMNIVNQLQSSGSPNGGIGSQFFSGNVANPSATFGGSGGDDVGAIATEMLFGSGIGGWII